MNIAFFLTPKSETVTLVNHMTTRQALEKMEFHKYSAVPVIDKNGRYVYTISEGDILWHLKHKEGMIFKDTETEKIGKVLRNRETKSVYINSDIESLYQLAVLQGFVPVVDDDNVFIGIIKRSDIIEYILSKMNNQDLVLRA